jgi:glutamyl-tRNA synthetase
MVDFLFLENPAIDDDAWNKTMSSDFAREVLTDFAAAITTAEWNHDSLKGILETWTEAHGLKLGKTQAPIRVAITGRTVGPPLFESLEILGRVETVRRLAAGLARLG